LIEDKSASKKIIAIDLLRALAALGVFYYHNHAGSMIAKFFGLSFFNYTDAFGATYAVPLFFLISGYCIHASNIKYVKANKSLPLREYYTRRLLRIYPPYFVALLFAVGVNYLMDVGHLPGYRDLLIHLFSLQGFTVAYFNTINVVLWTISIELAFYAIYPLFYYIRVKYDLNYALAFTLVVTCLCIAYFQIKGNVTIPQRFCVFNLWFAWCCGAFLADKKLLNPIDLKKHIYSWLYVIIVIAFVYLNYVPNNQFILCDQFNVLIWTAPMLFLLSKEDWLRQRQNWWFIKIVAAIGLSSYSLYLLHEPLIYLKNALAHKYLPARFQLAGVIAGIFIIPVITWFSFVFFEKPFIPKKRVEQAT
jgi:peptidoglycan/LPS O-acetylase OafA/YrhL